jgi:Ni,Fe-hydrogenase I large subunit
MIVALYIYVDGIAKRIELFEDEKISVTSSVQDIADVSKAKTDFTQSFTIPASVINNEIFKHWYESSIDGGFDQRIKYDGYIEIETQTFRKGGFALNDVKYKDGMVDAYNIVFYGNAKSIKDLFKEDKIASLDYSSLNHSFTSTE